MGYSRTITLFSVQTDEKRRVSSIIASVVVHAGAGGLVMLGLMYQAKMPRPILTAHYTVRQLDLEAPQAALRAAGKAIEYPGPTQSASTASSGNKPSIHPPVLQAAAHTPHGPQTLLQPDIKKPVELKEKIPVPAVAIWTPQKIAVKKIIAPLPQEAVDMEVKPSLNVPNEAVNLNDVEIAPSQHPLQNMHLVASTVTPVVMRALNKNSVLPVTAWQHSSQPAPASVVSLSDLAMTKGTVMLPPVNEAGSSSFPGVRIAAPSKNDTTGGEGNKAGSSSGAGSGQSRTENAGQRPGSGAAGSKNGARSGLPEGSDNGSSTGSALTADHISLPKGGQFGAVVVGDSLGGEFPEAAAAWSGRVAYTVYLHVGLDRSWIMQYALPRQSDAKSSGMVAQLKAPWPYTIVRPNLPAGSIEADALLVHGYVDQAGHFESLSVAFPPDFPEANFVLKSLQQWQFRPATENGQVAKVEVLLIIPAEVYSGMQQPPVVQSSSLVGATGVITPSSSSTGKR
jgi:hypothetical protein